MLVTRKITFLREHTIIPFARSFFSNTIIHYTLYEIHKCNHHSSIKSLRISHTYNEKWLALLYHDCDKFVLNVEDTIDYIFHSKFLVVIIINREVSVLNVSMSTRRLRYNLSMTRQAVIGSSGEEKWPTSDFVVWQYKYLLKRGGRGNVE